VATFITTPLHLQEVDCADQFNTVNKGRMWQLTVVRYYDSIYNV